MPVAELVRATQVYLRDARAPVGGVSAPLPSLRGAPVVVPLGAAGASSTSASRSPTASRAAAPAILVTDGREITRAVTFGELDGGLEPARERARRPRASARATASR